MRRSATSVHFDGGVGAQMAPAGRVLPAFTAAGFELEDRQILQDAVRCETGPSELLDFIQPRAAGAEAAPLDAAAKEPRDSSSGASAQAPREEMHGQSSGKAGTSTGPLPGAAEEEARLWLTRQLGAGPSLEEAEGQSDGGARVKSRPQAYDPQAGQVVLLLHATIDGQGGVGSDAVQVEVDPSGRVSLSSPHLKVPLAMKK